MLRSLYSGVSGMRNQQTKMDVISNNISNVTTTAFKSGRVRFQDMLSQTLRSASQPMDNGRGGINPRQVGLGMEVAGIDTLTNQGIPQSTGRPYDCSIAGDGYFVLSPDGGTTRVYSRDGAFSLDSNFNLENSDGYGVLGYNPSDVLNVNFTKPGVDWTVKTGAGSLGADSAININGIDFSFTSGDTLSTVIDKINNSAAGVNVKLDGGLVMQSNKGELKITNGTGDFAGIVADRSVGSAPEGIGLVIKDNLSDISIGGIDWSTAKADTAVTAESIITINGKSFDFVDSGATAPQINASTLKDIADEINKASVGVRVEFLDNGGMSISPVDGGKRIEIAADGTTPGIFKGLGNVADDGIELKQLGIPEINPINPNAKIDTFSISADGTIRGVYTDNSIINLGVISLAKFANPSGLLKVGGNNYSISNNSGSPQIGSGASGGRGDILQNTLEMSNVDLANEFTDMIITSRAFQANSKSITTSDEMLQELINLKR